MYIATILVSFLLTVAAIPAFIRFYHRAHISGQQMHEDVKQHKAKAGTPTMGGVVFLITSVFVTLVFSFLTGNFTRPVQLILFILVLYGIVGFLDDFLKVFRKINEGLNPKQKLALQLLGGIIFYLFSERHGAGSLLNVFGWDIYLGHFYIVFALFWLVGFSNAVNLTDGIDGLASISVTISFNCLFHHRCLAKTNRYPLCAISMIGALLGFFVYNHKPAKIFMGDVGSLALGGMLATLSMALHVEWTLLLIGIVYVFETSSVMLQVSYFKWTKKRTGEGRRIFRMTPFHHHLELGGLSGNGPKWSEWKVDAFLWSVGAGMSALTLLIYYLTNS